MSADIGRVIAEDWRTEYSDFGTVEGRLETIQDKGTLLIYVRDPLFSSSVRCYFDEDLLPQVFECFRKRVEITQAKRCAPCGNCSEYKIHVAGNVRQGATGGKWQGWKSAPDNPETD